LQCVAVLCSVCNSDVLSGPQGRACPSIEFGFVSTNMGLHCSVPIEPITRLVFKKIKLKKFELRSKNKLEIHSTSCQHLACRDRAMCGCLFRYFRNKLSRSTDKHDPQHTTYFCTPQHTATHCNTLQHTATHCNTLQHTATHCNTLQHIATHCNALQYTTTRYNQVYTLRHTHCNTRTATHALQHAHYNILPTQFLCKKTM